MAPDGDVFLLKVPTSLPDQSEGVMRGIEALAAERCEANEIALDDLEKA